MPDCREGAESPQNRSVGPGRERDGAQHRIRNASERLSGRTLSESSSHKGCTRIAQHVPFLFETTQIVQMCWLFGRVAINRRMGDRFAAITGIVQSQLNW